MFWIMKTISMSLALMGLAFGADPAAAQPAVPPIDEPAVTAEATTQTLSSVEVTGATSGTLKLLYDLETANGRHQAVHALFTQIRLDEVFDEKVESQGELWFRKPYEFRADYSDANRIVTLINKDAFYLYTPSLEQVSFYNFENEAEQQQQMHHLMLGFGFKTEKLLEIYEVHSSEDEAAPLADLKENGMDPAKIALLVFKPRGEHTQTSPFQELKLYVDKASRLPEKIWYRDLNNASMTLTMQKIDTDPALEDSLFDRDRLFPKNVTMVDQRNTQ